MIPYMRTVYLFMFQLTFTMSKVRILNDYISGLCTSVLHNALSYWMKGHRLSSAFTASLPYAVSFRPCRSLGSQGQIVDNYALVFSLMVIIIIEHQ